MIVVREARPEDAEAMGRIHVDAWRWAYAGVMSADFLTQLDVEHSGQEWAEHLRAEMAEGQQTLVAELDGEVVAMCTVGPYRARKRRDPYVELWMLNAHPTATGTGAATTLHAEAVSRLAATGRRTAALWVVEENPRARRFYEREGWRPDGTRRMERLGGSEVPELRYVRDLAAVRHAGHG
jgi:RimJ/RimL family protein N-acetyltransferase